MLTLAEAGGDTFLLWLLSDLFEALITTLSVGEALVSFLNQDGTPLPVDQVKIIPPESESGSSIAAL